MLVNSGGDVCYLLRGKLGTTCGGGSAGAFYAPPSRGAATGDKLSTSFV